MALILRKDLSIAADFGYPEPGNFGVSCTEVLSNKTDQNWMPSAAFPGWLISIFAVCPGVSLLKHTLDVKIPLQKVLFGTFL